MKIFRRSQKMLIASHILHVILELFISTFLTSYIVSLTPDSVFGNGLINVGIFYVSWFITYPLLNIVVSHFVDKSNRTTMLKIGIIVNAILLTAIVLWGEQISKWLVFAGVLCGISDAFYYSSYLVIKNEINTNETFKEYNLFITILVNLVKIIVPTLLGFIIDFSSYSFASICVIIVTIASFILTFFIKSPKPENSQFEMKKYLLFLKENKDIRKKISYTYLNAVLAGFKNGYKIIVVILTIYTFKTNLNLGIFTSLFSLATMLLLIIYKKTDKHPKISQFLIYLIVGLLPFVMGIIMCLWLNKITLTIFNFCLTIAIYFGDYLGSVERDAIIKLVKKDEFISEHQCVFETTTCLFRVVCYSLFIICGIFGGELAFKIFLCAILAISPVKNLVMYKQRLIREELEKQQL